MSRSSEAMHEALRQSMQESRTSISKAWGTSVLGEFDYSIDFPQAEAVASRLRVIYAENGMGKTSFLRALYYLLNPTLQNLAYLLEIPLSVVGAEFRSGWTVEAKLPSEDEPRLELMLLPPRNSHMGSEILWVGAETLESRMAGRSWTRSKDVIRFRELLKSAACPTEFVGENRAVLSSLSNLLEADDHASRLSPLAKIRAAETSRMDVRGALDDLANEFVRMSFNVMSERPEKQTGGTYLEIARQILAGGSTPPPPAEAQAILARRAVSILKNGSGSAKYGLIPITQVEGIRKAVLAADRDSERLQQLYTVVDPYLTSLEEDIERVRNSQEIIHTFVNSVNSFLTRKKLTFTVMAGMKLVDMKQTEIEPDSLSSGEKHLLLLLSRAALARFTGTFMIIDEPELSLGLRWQRNLLEELLSCTEGSGVQFLVATHSVQIMGDQNEILSPSESN